MAGFAGGVQHFISITDSFSMGIGDVDKVRGRMIRRARGAAA
jgi:hypothetical protein